MFIWSPAELWSPAKCSLWVSVKGQHEECGFRMAICFCCREWSIATAAPFGLQTTVPKGWHKTVATNDEFACIEALTNTVNIN
jgi:TRAP-type mannitol/chloroaromatic compound transport system substrate-binding protein